MKFIVMHKTNDHWEAGTPPSAELVARVGKLIGEMNEAKVLLAGEGLRASSLGQRVEHKGGKRSVTRGPFKAANKAPAGFLILRVPSIERAVELSAPLGDIFGDAEIDVRPVTEPWDIGMAPRPQGLSTHRFMALYKVAGARESAVHTAEIDAAMKRLTDELSAAGVLIAAERFQPSAKGKRLERAQSAAKIRVLDGPFTETKELLAGFVLLSVKSIEEALRWAKRYVEVVGAEEVDVVACD